MESEIIRIYPDSHQVRGSSGYFMAETINGNVLIVSGSDMEHFEGRLVVSQGKACKLCPLTVENSKTVRKLFPFTNPTSAAGHDASIGLGDRLGVASPGHIKLIRGFDVFPILAQQSMRELNLTGRTYEDVLAAAVWAVFREGYKKGYGADGDHLKTADEVKYALRCGYSMITLDCSEHIRNDLADAEQTAIDAQYGTLPPDVRSELENEYLNTPYIIDKGIAINFTEADFRRTVLIYLEAINHAAAIYYDLIEGTGVDFEVSIDETQSVTTLQSHFFVANELIKRGVAVSSIAPRFIGEFQKGIDYIGDTDAFERDFAVHAKIASRFGYKVSVHSGSDKFSIFPAVGRLTNGKFHLKTAGTSWLEALRVIAENAPELYREIHAFAMDNLAEAREYYHITEDISDIADINNISNDALRDYLGLDSARQVLHITYGLVLMAKAPDGATLFRDRIYKALREFEPEYFDALGKHIGLHLDALGAR